jgi:hypothetical protein
LDGRRVEQPTFNVVEQDEIVDGIANFWQFALAPEQLSQILAERGIQSTPAIILLVAD